MNEFSPDYSNENALNNRVSPAHLRLRLGIEEDRETRVFGQGLGFFHIENWYSAHAFIRLFLRLCLLYGRARRNALAIEIRENELRIQDLPTAFDGFTILQISDLHLDMNADIPHALIERVRAVDYDICVLTGDYRAKTYGSCQPALAAMQRLRTHLRDPVYGILGNHDSIQMVPALEAMGIHMLLNESIALERAGATIYLSGIDDPHYYRADNLEKTCEALPANAIAILLAHSPEIYRQAAHAGFVAMLCGHTHGGQICLPGGYPIMTNANCPRRFCAGAWTYRRLIGYTSVGSGPSMVDVRLNCPPEITLHRLVTGDS